MSLFEVHQSSIKRWRMCKRAYWYSYILKLQKRKKSGPLWRGTIAHEMLEAKANGLDPMAPLESMEAEYEKLFQDEKDYYGNIPEQVKLIMSGYFDYYEEDDLTPIAIGKDKKKKAEHKFAIELAPGIIFKGKIDQVARDKQKHNWLLDHKTHKVLPETGLKYSDIQSAIYVSVLNRLAPSLKIYGVCWDYIRWKMPSIPEVLKSGEMSKRAIDTTWTVYRAALKRAGLKTSDYLDMRDRLKEKESSFYRREYLPIHGSLVDNVLAEAITTAKEMKERAGHDTTRNIERHCTYCDFYMLCQAELRGLDTDYMLKTDYTEKPDAENETENEELTD